MRNELAGATSLLAKAGSDVFVTGVLPETSAMVANAKVKITKTLCVLLSSEIVRMEVMRCSMKSGSF